MLLHARTSSAPAEKGKSPNGFLPKRQKFWVVEWLPIARAHRDHWRSRRPVRHTLEVNSFGQPAET